LADRYGNFLRPLVERGSAAVTSNVFVKQQQDPEFRAALKAAKEEAANERDET
jgi:hypothetical protein